ILLFFFSSRRRHTSFSRDWSSDVCSSDLGAVAPQYFVDSLRIVAEPCTDGLHGYLLRRDLAQIDQYPARTCKALAGLCRIGDAKEPAIGHSQACGSLHVDEKGVHPVGQPGDLQPAACKRAALYLAPVEIFNRSEERRVGKACR